MRRETQEVQVQVRQAPKYLTFAMFGAVIGLVISAVVSLIAMAQPRDPADADDPTRQISPMQAFLLLGLTLAVVCALVMLVIALVLDRVMARRARVASAVHEKFTSDGEEAAADAVAGPVSESSAGGGLARGAGATIDAEASDGGADASSEDRTNSTSGGEDKE
ncbi:hypothetical protein F8O07_03080 [Pseudoclavibacter sp. CFCC 13796]|uniref:ABC transporter permease n=1 Tax=Pseudoclavibacter sp. CFCC 13796 TaxID=2615179 RepID=UPI001300D4A6|nr:ABC transporter permease [Pseudoclavibacter sp. CFCC 13796]KAB1660966.1 hypothetical protein F8O07_03080 [Pseudoclavibacter sp. CFCC 13796]